MKKLSFVTAAWALLVATSLAQDKSAIGILLAAGDIARCDGTSKDQETAALLTREIGEAKGTPVRVIALGDLAYPNGEEQSFKCFAKTWGQHRDVMLAVPGNHDWRTEKGRWYFEYFAKSPAMPEDKDRKGYYSASFPETSAHAWQLIGINTNEGYGEKAGQMNWLDGVLKDSKNRCVLLFSHAFRFSSGDHGHNDLKSKVAVPQAHLKEAYKLLHKHKGSLILSGHDHHFEQFGPQNVNGKFAKDGVRSFIVGTGGYTPYREHKTFAPNSVKRIWKTHGVLKVVMYSDRYEASFLNIDGSTVKLQPDSVTCNTRP